MRHLIRIPKQSMLLLAFLALQANAAEHVIDQHNKEFSHSHLTVKAGDKVTFTNSDSYFHNVYSLSSVKSFDLGSYPKGQSKTVVLATPGEVVAQCAIHPKMKVTITVDK